MLISVHRHVTLTAMIALLASPARSSGSRKDGQHVPEGEGAVVPVHFHAFETDTDRLHDGPEQERAEEREQQDEEQDVTDRSDHVCCSIDSMSRTLSNGSPLAIVILSEGVLAAGLP